MKKGHWFIGLFYALYFILSLFSMKIIHHIQGKANEFVYTSYIPLYMRKDVIINTIWSTINTLIPSINPIFYCNDLFSLFESIFFFWNY